MAFVKKKPKKKAVKRKVSKKKVIKRRIVRKQPSKRRPSRKKAPPKGKVALKLPKGDVVGTVTHYFPKVRAAVVKLKAPLAVGNMIQLKGHTTDFKQTITSLQIDRVPITLAKKGQEIGLLVDSRVRQRDTVYKVKS